MSFLKLAGYHVLVTGAAGGIGGQAVKEFLSHGCKVTALDLRPTTNLPPSPSLFSVAADISDEQSVESAIAKAVTHFGPLNILVANAGITDESAFLPVWDMPLDIWEKTYAINVRGTFLCIKHFLRSVDTAQKALPGGDGELENVAIVVTGSECGKFGQAGHVEYASGKAGLQYGLVRSVKNEIVKLNGRARINAVAPGWVDTPLIEGRLDDPREMWVEAQATVPLKKIARPEDVARTMAFLASHAAAGHITGECLSVDGGMEGRIIWKESEVLPRGPAAISTSSSTLKVTLQAAAAKVLPIGAAGPSASASAAPPSIPPVIRKKAPRIRVTITVDFDALSGYLGTGTHPNNGLADYSAGIFAAQVGVPRLLKVFKKLGIQDKITWFVPGHSMETFQERMQEIVDSGAEIGLHGYCHEGASQLTEEQERDVLEHCIAVAKKYTGKKPVGYRAPLYNIRASTIKLLEEHGFLYDTSLTHHDSTPYFLPHPPSLFTHPESTAAPMGIPIDFSKPASSWMHPTPLLDNISSIVELPANWYGEDMTPLQFYQHTPNSQGYVDVNVVEAMWKRRFLWLWENEAEVGGETVFGLVLHPDTSGMAHVVGMVEGFLGWLRGGFGEGVEWCVCEDVARGWRERCTMK